MKALIKKLVETTGPSGYESQIRAAVREEVEPSQMRCAWMPWAT